MNSRIVKCIVFLVILLVGAGLMHAQSDKKIKKFEKKLNEFRYSLYADLENIENLNKLFDES
ncbi:MAG TPA: hypothetical protein DDX98_05270, partial [Bacteroidales bacterium]|nr:hypothetical protein [Bacteroidales bacterium]